MAEDSRLSHAGTVELLLTVLDVGAHAAHDARKFADACVTGGNGQGANCPAGCPHAHGRPAGASRCFGAFGTSAARPSPDLCWTAHRPMAGDASGDASHIGAEVRGWIAEA